MNSKKQPNGCFLCYNIVGDTMKKELVNNVKNIIFNEVPLVSNLANISKLIYDSFEGTCWAGFYICYEDLEEMYLGPFQGPVACTKISFDKGVCGACVRRKESILVPDVHKFEGHIACYSLTNSEVVVPIIKNNKVVGVIDLDSINYNNYSIEDVLILEKVANIIKDLF